ncbi:MAG: hypothetical protein U5K27_15760 [Desulfotignum sp.]|nr:hypothetical protein [Desulfotignum sp.]
MDLETLINIILVFLFLLITTLVRGLKARQKNKKVKTQKQSAKPSVFSFFQKIRDQIQESLQELERQAREKRADRKPEPEPSDSTFWDELSDEEEIQDKLEKPRERERKPEYAYTRDQTEDPTQKMAPEVQVQDREIKTPSSSKEVPPPTIHPYGRRPSLRQAVVWAEIIGKPAALKKDPPGSVF